ncbi:hypothetical protein PHYBOEH_008907 [Phytophthora boehmeriae]|uniref:Uncharacterized protein n=1 Tax=Phytophthora boehmeriae TaxID=109152 RepID=A0A8T1VXR8_9STRA|nr:hypothetical protein PHYBOEH_008907 [Phytophthora boehmeriae]
MPLDVTVKPLPAACEASQDTIAQILLHSQGHFRLLERSLQDFQHLERRLQLEKAHSAPIPSVIAAIQAYCGDFDPRTSFYAPDQRGFRLAFALEAFLNQLVARSELLETSLALKTFFHADILTMHKSTGQSYNQAVQEGLNPSEDWEEERVPAGCVVEHEVAVDVPEVEQSKRLVLWKFASQGAGIVFSADFVDTVPGLEQDESGDVDPYSSSELLASTEAVDTQQEAVHYRTRCIFPDKVEDATAVYGHFVTDKAGIVTLQWENADTSSVLSKPVRFQVKVVPLSAAPSVLEIEQSLTAIDTSAWLYEYVLDSEATLLEDIPGWSNDESEDGFGDEDSIYDDNVEGGGLRTEETPKQTAVLERRTHELEEKVIRLEETLTTTKQELKSALDRVQIAEEIYKANLETITQLECAPKAIKPSVKSETTAEVSGRDLTGPVESPTRNQADGVGKEPQPEGTLQAELERVQKLCAGFQEQCLWRSVESMELEAQLAASQVEVTSWRDKHAEQAAQLEEVEAQNRTLRSHKKLLVQEVKRLQPYSQVNIAALVQEAQEARMVQRSLQAKLDLRETAVSAEGGSADFVLVEASNEDV